MNDQRVKTDNEVIAEFMGFSSVSTEHDTFWNPADKPQATVNNWKFHTNQLEYFRTSWDWLMPVVIKCDEICDAKEREFPEDKDLDDATGWRSWSYHRVGLSTDIKKVYKNVLTFIHWYQKQKSS